MFVSFSGVPTRLGYVFFLSFSLFVNSANRVLLHGHLNFFLGNIKLFLQVEALQNCHNLQANIINFLVSWAKILGSSFNISKCRSMAFTHLKNKFCFGYNINETFISNIENSVKVLGFVFSLSLSSHIHIKAICCKPLKPYVLLNEYLSCLV